jgi:hypothetical protein
VSYITEYTKFTRNDLLGKSGVYIILNLINGKFYIGGAIDFYARFRLHIADLLKNKHFNKHLQNSVNKYGIENFEFSILEEYSKDITFDMETYWINILGATNRNIGYNIDSYSKTRLGAILTEDTKNKISKALLGRKISEDQLKLHKERIRESKGRSIVQLDVQGNFIKEFECINDAAKELNILCTNIVALLKDNKRKTIKGFKFLYKEDYNLDKNYLTAIGKTREKVGKFDLLFNLLEEYNNSSEAAEKNNINKHCINTVCIYHKNKRPNKNGKKNITYKGFIWKYIN